MEPALTEHAQIGGYRPGVPSVMLVFSDGTLQLGQCGRLSMKIALMCRITVGD